jgi:2-dehydro-3-deoxygluconokinase
MLEMVTLGETMVLLLAEQAGPMREATTFRRYIAGAESNVAVGLCRLGHTAGWMSRVGDDEFGRAIVFRLRGEGVDTSHVISDPAAQTGIVVRERREAGPIDQTYYRHGSAASRLSPGDLDPAYITNASFLHLTGITPALSTSCREAVFAAAEIAQGTTTTVVLDPNFRSKLWSRQDFRRVVRDLAGRVDILLPGMDEAAVLTGESDPEAAARDLRKLGPSVVVIKVGAQGAVAIVNDQVVRAPAMPLERVIDPVGAGDAFAAGLISGLLRDFSVEEALRLANRSGAFAMCAPGDMESLPRRAELEVEAVGDVRR